jgi:flavin-dependent dehydrogenase
MAIKMNKKILVAGAGHGGLATAVNLARNGFAVMVIEAQREEDLGHDWTDCFEPSSFRLAGLAQPHRTWCTYRTEPTFFATKERTGLAVSMPTGQSQIKMERKTLLAHLIAEARAVGVNFRFSCKINGPVILGERVAGIATQQGNFYGDLVIDAAGMHSPVRRNLPESFGIQREVKEGEKLFVYRAIFNKERNAEQTDRVPAEKYRVFLFPGNDAGISWLIEEEDGFDFLFAQFTPFPPDAPSRELERLRAIEPALGHMVARGGVTTEIPVGHTLSRMVASGYAAVGDSAFMTMPLIGSGISNTLRAGKLLADAILADKTGHYTQHTLWKYQTAYFKQLGRDLAEFSCVKDFIQTVTREEVDFLYEMGVLAFEKMELNPECRNVLDFLRGVPFTAVKKAAGIISNRPLLRKLAALSLAVGRVSAVCAAMPRRYSQRGTALWQKRFENVFASSQEEMKAPAPKRILNNVWRKDKNEEAVS